MSNVTPIGEAPSAQDPAETETPRPTGPPSAAALSLLEKLRGVARVNAEHRGRGHAILQVETLDDETRAAIDELRLHGADIRVSSGERDIVIHAPDELATR